MRQFLADVGAGTVLAFINNWDVIAANIVVIAGRILIEWIILKQKQAQSKKEKPEQ